MHKERQIEVAQYTQAMLRELLEKARAERMDDLAHFLEMAYLLAGEIVRDDKPNPPLS